MNSSSFSGESTTALAVVLPKSQPTSTGPATSAAARADAERLRSNSATNEVRSSAQATSARPPALAFSSCWPSSTHQRSRSRPW